MTSQRPPALGDAPSAVAATDNCADRAASAAAGSSRRVLLLQGPMGPFFRHFATELSASGHSVVNVTFNGGDHFFCGGPAAIPFRGGREDWPAFLTALLADLRIDRIFLFGDCRWYHRVAKQIAARRGVELFVFEEGYLRPHFITLEANGVNGYSSISRDPLRYRDEPVCRLAERGRTGDGRWSAACHAMLYCAATLWHTRTFPHYEHHRPLDAFGEGLRWLRAGLGELVFRVTEWPRRRRLLGDSFAPFFLVPLQVHQDAQVLVHSPYPSVDAFITEVVGSFADHAPPSATLVFKHHPLDLAYRDYAGLIRGLATRHRVGNRVRYLHVGDLERLLRRCCGVVTINSTAGLSAIQAGRPVKVLGRAVYDMPGLTFQGTTDEFWSDPGRVDADLFERFRGWLLRHVQIAGSFYRRPRGTRSPTGIRWPAAVAERLGLHDGD